MKKGIFLFLFIFLFVNQVQALESLWYYTETPRSRESLNKNIGKINILGPQVYELGMNGTITGNMSDEVLTLAKNNNVKVMPLLANTNGKFFNQKTILNLLNDTKNWEKVSKYMREEAYKNGYYGWQMDLENIPVTHKDKLNKMMQYFKSEFDKDGLKLSIAVVSKISDNPKDYKKSYWDNWAGAYDYKILASTTDFISVMAYDQPQSPGPVATLSWSKKVLDYSLKNIPKEKISFGIPAYGWAYRSTDLKNGKGHFTMVDYKFTKSILFNFDKSDANNMTTGAGTSKIFGNISWVSYNKGGKNYTIWYEDKDSFKAKYDQLKKANVLGYSAWVLGDEDDRVFDIK